MRVELRVVVYRFPTSVSLLAFEAGSSESIGYLDASCGLIRMELANFLKFTSAKRLKKDIIVSVLFFFKVICGTLDDTANISRNGTEKGGC